MRHATISDAFNAASGFTQQGLGFLTKEKEYELDAKLFHHSIEREKVEKELIADLTRIDPETGENIYQDNPEEYEKHVKEKLAEWKNNAVKDGAKSAYLSPTIKDGKLVGGMGAGGQGSKYYMDRLSRMDEQGNEVMRQRVTAFRDETNKQRADVAHAKTYADIDNAEWDVQTTLNAKMEEFNRYEGVRGLDPIAKFKERAAIVDYAFNQSLSIDIGNKNIKNAMDEIDGNLKSLAEEYLSPYLGEGESLDSFLEDKEKRIEAAKGAVRKAIYKRNVDRLSAADKKWNREIHDALRRNDLNGLLKAQQDYYAGVRMRDDALKSGEYDRADDPRIAAMFAVPPGLFGGGGGSGSGSSDEDIRDYRKYIIEGIADGSWTHEEGRAKFADWVGKKAEASGDKRAFEEKHAGAINFFGFWDDAKDYLIKSDPAYKAAFNVLDNAVKSWQTKVPKGQEALREWQGELLGMWLYDQFTDEKGATRMTPEQLVKEAERVSGLLIGGKISFLKEANYEGGANEKTFAKVLKEREENPWARFVIGQGVNAKSYNFGNENYEEKFMEQSRDFLSTITGVPVSDISHGHDKEGKFDETAGLTFQITGQGDKNGNYRFGSNGRTYWVEERINGEWKPSPRFKGTASQAEREAKRKNDEDTYDHRERKWNERVEQDNKELMEMLENAKDHWEREDILMQMKNRITPEELRKAGFDPNTGEKL